MLTFLAALHSSMRYFSKCLKFIQMLCCFVVVCLVIHASSGKRPYFSSAPLPTALLLLCSSHLLINTFLFATSITTDLIYDTPIVWGNSLVFFALLTAVGTSTAMACRGFNNMLEKELFAAGALAIFSAFTSILECWASCDITTTLSALRLQG